MLKHLLRFLLIVIVVAAAAIWYLTRPGTAVLTEDQSTGRVPVLTEKQNEILPWVSIAKPVGWQANEAPVAAKGLKVTRFAEGLSHPRSMLVLPNGDVLVAETNHPPSEGGGGIQNWIADKLMAQAGAGDPSPNRIMLLRDANGDGKADSKSEFLTGLNSPYGMALVGNTLYVANTDALMAYPYHEGETKISGEGRKILRLPAQAPNYHWTRNIVASPDGNLLYVAIGSDSNIGENGLDNEEFRAGILEVNPKTGDYRIYASGLRNPVGMAWEPNSNLLWTVVNERDMLGPDLVPDYLTQVDFGGFYGWPWNYWGGYEDKRVQPARPELREYTHRPDYALGNHVAPLGLTFATGQKLGGAYASGAFVGLHGSWNRKPLSGYKVVFVPFTKDGRPADGHPKDLLTGFLNADGKAHGRPVDVQFDKTGALLVSDDVGGMVWRVSSAQ